MGLSEKIAFPHHFTGRGTSYWVVFPRVDIIQRMTNP